ncbi:MAG: SBBP repeat-containing protein, partial [candidate division WOR-3 bacterium]
MKSHAFVLAVLLPLGLAAGTVDTAWVRRYDGPRHGQDWTTCLAVDSLGNVYVAGPSAADTGYVNLDYVVIKYRPDGAVAW